MNTNEALAVLDIATTPANAGKLSRQDYANCQVALGVLAQFVEANTPKPDEPKKRGPKPRDESAPA